MRRFLVGVAVLATGCGGSFLDDPIPPSTPVSAKVQTPRPAPPPGALFRKDVADTVTQGLGYFLQRVSVDPSIVGGKFQGFRIVELRPAEFWTGVDLRPGDVVEQVNGKPIERDIDAYEVFQTLPSAKELRVTFLRNGVQRDLVYSIVDPGKAPATPAKNSPPAAPTKAAPPAAPAPPAASRASGT